MISPTYRHTAAKMYAPFSQYVCMLNYHTCVCLNSCLSTVVPISGGIERSCQATIPATAWLLCPEGGHPSHPSLFTSLLLFFSPFTPLKRSMLRCLVPQLRAGILHWRTPISESHQPRLNLLYRPKAMAASTMVCGPAVTLDCSPGSVPSMKSASVWQSRGKRLLCKYMLLSIYMTAE
jgi:hypothetical protein